MLHMDIFSADFLTELSINVRINLLSVNLIGFLNSLSKFRLTSTSDLEIRLNIKDGIEESNQELIYKKSDWYYC